MLNSGKLRLCGYAMPKLHGQNLLVFPVHWHQARAPLQGGFLSRQGAVYFTVSPSGRAGSEGRSQDGRQPQDKVQRSRRDVSWVQNKYIQKFEVQMTNNYTNKTLNQGWTASYFTSQVHCLVKDFSSHSTVALENPGVKLAIGGGGARYKRHSYVPGGHDQRWKLHHDISSDKVTLTFHKKKTVHL